MSETRLELDYLGCPQTILSGYARGFILSSSAAFLRVSR